MELLFPYVWISEDINPSELTPGQNSTNIYKCLVDLDSRTFAVEEEFEAPFYVPSGYNLNDYGLSYYYLPPQ